MPRKHSTEPPAPSAPGEWTIEKRHRDWMVIDPRATSSPGDLTRYVGTFWDSVSGTRHTTVAQGELVWEASRPIPLTWIGPHRFRLPDGQELEFIGTGSGVTSVRLMGRNAPRVLAPVAPADISASALGELLGTYYSEELDLRITVAVHEGALVLRQPFGVERRLRPVFAGGFTTPLPGTTTVVFSRNGTGRVDGLGVWMTAARSIRFVRE